MKKILAVLLALVMVLSLAACSASAEKDTSSNETNETQSGTNDTQSQTDETLKVAFLYDSPVGDGGWITSHELGQQAVAAMPGVNHNRIWHVKISFSNTISLLGYVKKIQKRLDFYALKRYYFVQAIL